MDKKFLDEIVERAIQDGGVTVELGSQKVIEQLDEWLFPRWPDLTVVVPANRLEPAIAEFIAAHRDKMHDTYLGIWYENGNYYIDANAHIANLGDARRVARTYSEQSSRAIISAYNPARDKTEYFQKGDHE